jgi:GTP-binding protein Era
MAFRAGYVALIGKPNVGKSTLLNLIVGQKVSIVSNKPQTTRKRVIGIAHGEGYQIAFIDTPGIHEPHTQLGKAMIDSARSALSGIDLLVYVADGSHFPGEVDKQIADMIKASASDVPLVICMNKMDLLKADNVQRNVDGYTGVFGSEDFMMTTATRGQNVGKLVEMIVERLPEQPALYGEDEFTDQSSRFMAAEFVREKILIATRQEVPHATGVMIDDWNESEGTLHIHATIIVERASQRAILIGRGGQFIKEIGTKARGEIEAMLGQKIYLELLVKVEEDWRMSPRLLHELEYSE